MLEIGLGDRRYGQPFETPVSAHEAGDERCCRSAENRRRSVVLLEVAALSHDSDAVTQPDGLLDVVGDEQDRLVHLVL